MLYIFLINNGRLCGLYKDFINYVIVWRQPYAHGPVSISIIARSLFGQKIIIFMM